LSDTIKVVIWFIFAILIDAVVDPSWSALIHLLYPDNYFSNWNWAVQFVWFHVLPFGFSNAIEGVVYSVLKKMI
jgi:hypothetical protein